MPPNFKSRFGRYLEEVKKVSTAHSKAFYFLEFVRSVFQKIEADYAYKLLPELEKYIRAEDSGAIAVKGRIDALMGNLIIEFKRNLDRERKDAKEELKKYIFAVWSKRGMQTKYLLLASDGVKIEVYRPKVKGAEINLENISLKEIDRIKLDLAKVEDAYVWLDRYLLYQEPQPPTTESFVKIFGIGSPVYKQSVGILKDAWDENKENPQIRVLFDEWSNYLRIVYGSDVGSEDLFLRHTYLATLVKFMAYALSEREKTPLFPLSKDEALNTIDGTMFNRIGIHNIVEKDFFIWPLRVSEDFAYDFSRHLIEHLSYFDVSQTDEDVLKGLYQELVDPEERHDLGEFYTPDWLADYIVQKVIRDPEAKVLDPACGSGTFLVMAIKRKMKLLKGREKSEVLENIFSSVVGMDVHPLAVVISTVNYLIALGDLVKYRKGAIYVPVYLADSIRLPLFQKTYEAIEVYRNHRNQRPTDLLLPAKIVEERELLDRVMSAIERIIPSEHDVSKEGLERETSVKLSDKEASILFDLINKLRKLREEGKDTIWTYILRNVYKPHSLKGNFDYVIGNPPWLSYRYASSDYQEFIKQQVIDYYKLLKSEDTALITQMDLATLFFARSSDLYLKESGAIGFVMPRGVFAADQHDKFRGCSFKPSLRFKEIIDLNDVKTLFNIPACVIIAEKGEGITYPIEGEIISGKLKRKNARWEEAKKSMDRRKVNFYLNEVGKRSFLSERKFEGALGESFYKNKFRNGATIYPRNFWFVEIKPHPHWGFDPDCPPLETSKEVKKQAKEAYKDARISRKVSRKFLYATLRGSELVPFSHLPFKLIVLPAIVEGGMFKMLNKRKAGEFGYSDLANWIKDVEKMWEIRKKKGIKETAVEWLNYRNKVVIQNPNAKYKVLYLTCGKNIAACMLDLKRDKLEVEINNKRISLAGFVADYTTYHYEIKDREEALYLTAILNSPEINKLIKDMQPSGLFGPRDICKKVLDLSISKYNSKDHTHQRLVKLAEKCIEKSKQKLPELVERYRSIAYIRKGIKEELSAELSEVSTLTWDVLSKAKSGEPAFKKWIK